MSTMRHSNIFCSQGLHEDLCNIVKLFAFIPMDVTSAIYAGIPVALYTWLYLPFSFQMDSVIGFQALATRTDLPHKYTILTRN